MSEVEQILNQFHHAKHAERVSSGLETVICVSGFISYLELQNALKLKYGGILNQATEWQGWITN